MRIVGTAKSTHILTNCMELSPGEAASPSATQELPTILWNQEIHYCVHTSPHLNPYPEPDKSSP
jgi:hypothetical protein